MVRSLADLRRTRQHHHVLAVRTASPWSTGLPLRRATSTSTTGCTRPSATWASTPGTSRSTASRRTAGKTPTQCRNSTTSMSLWARPRMVSSMWARRPLMPVGECTPAAGPAVFPVVAGRPVRQPAAGALPCPNRGGIGQGEIAASACSSEGSRSPLLVRAGGLASACGAREEYAEAWICAVPRREVAVVDEVAGRLQVVGPAGVPGGDLAPYEGGPVSNDHGGGRAGGLRGPGRCRTSATAAEELVLIFLSPLRRVGAAWLAIH